MALPAPINILYLPTHFIVAGDAAATARNITADQLTYRLCILAGLVSLVGFIWLALSLYNLFKDVDRMQARLLVGLVLGGAAAGIANMINETAPLVLLSGMGYLSAFTAPQLDTLALAFLKIRGSGISLEMAFWALWLLPFGVLVMKSGFMPRLIGVLLIVGCFGYLAVSVTGILFPPHRALVNRIAMPFYSVGELSVIAWFIIKGGTVPLPAVVRERVGRPGSSVPLS
ncbi:MAG: DUF4386 domain-containing protein [Gemmatimonadaceae bacterium]|nr:DUF4386 domain-containing protein [Gemmatimonadaceae bacterium]